MNPIAASAPHQMRQESEDLAMRLERNRGGWDLTDVPVFSEEEKKLLPKAWKFLEDKKVTRNISVSDIEKLAKESGLPETVIAQVAANRFSIFPEEFDYERDKALAQRALKFLEGKKDLPKKLSEYDFVVLSSESGLSIQTIIEASKYMH